MLPPVFHPVLAAAPRTDDMREMLDALHREGHAPDVCSAHAEIVDWWAANESKFRLEIELFLEQGRVGFRDRLEIARSLVRSFGVQKAMDIPPNSRAEFIRRLRQIWRHHT